MATTGCWSILDQIHGLPGLRVIPKAKRGSPGFAHLFGADRNHLANRGCRSITANSTIRPTGAVRGPGSIPRLFQESRVWIVCSPKTGEKQREPNLTMSKQPGANGCAPAVASPPPGVP